MKPFISLFAGALLMLGAVACKGESKVSDTPETLAKLDNCQKGAADKEKLIKDYESQIAELEKNKANGNEIVLTIEGNALTVKAGAGGAPPVIDEKAAAAGSQKFLDIVSKSRGAIQKCYEQALKKNTGLQAKTITLKVSASFAATGDFQKTSFSPSVSDTFDQCLRAVASKWSLPGSTQAMTFQAQVSLTPN